MEPRSTARRAHAARGRSLGGVGIAVGVVTLLSACFLPAVGPEASTGPGASVAPAEPGISREAAAELLNAVPGLKLASVGSHISGISTEAIVEVIVDDESAIRAEGVLEYVLRVGWATKVSNEPSQISLIVWKEATRVDLQAEANAILGVDQEAIPELFSVHLDPAEDSLGTWPGAVPALPAG
jgi:hypothetical protein